MVVSASEAAKPAAVSVSATVQDDDDDDDLDKSDAVADVEEEGGNNSSPKKKPTQQSCRSGRTPTKDTAGQKPTAAPKQTCISFATASDADKLPPSAPITNPKLPAVSSVPSPAEQPPTPKLTVSATATDQPPPASSSAAVPAKLATAAVNVLPHLAAKTRSNAALAATVAKKK